jgi:uncharacterized protein YecE (DUF72 family)
VPEHFRFAVKIPKAITHEQKLHDVGWLLDSFLREVSGLGEKLGPLLVQLPPSLAFDPGVAGAFFAAFRERHGGSVVCEPRHQSWFSPEADELLCKFQVARVAADPAPATGAEIPGGWDGLTYYRLHGSPQMYYSEYSAAYIATFAAAVKALAGRGAPVWCIFDNTAEGAATKNALALVQQV